MKKIINRIRRKMIHWLGGVTQKESFMVSCEMVNVCQYRRVRLIRSYLELLNGTDTDTWCKAAYAYIERLERECREECDEDALDALERVETEIPELNENKY